MATPPKRTPRPMTVVNRQHITPNMIRVRFAADWMTDLPAGIEGAHFKLLLPAPGQEPDAFWADIDAGQRPAVRTYTIRHLSPAEGWIDVDFVDHGDAGPASAFARRCRAGDHCGFAGPGPVKVAHYEADQYIVAADMSALPVAAATLEAMPRNARGLALLEITSPADQQDIDSPDGVEMIWLINPDPAQPPRQSVERIIALPAFDGRVQTCIAGESSMIKTLRHELMVKRALPKTDVYLSGYWKIGLIEDEHQKMKNAETQGA